MAFKYCLLNAHFYGLVIYMDKALERLVKVSEKNNFVIMKLFDNVYCLERSYDENMTIKQCRECTNNLLNELESQGFNADHDYESKLERPLIEVSL